MACVVWQYSCLPLNWCVFSRQRYVLGDKAMQRMAESNIFISGVGGIGIEIGE